MNDFTKQELKHIIYGLDLLLKTEQPKYRIKEIKAAIDKASEKQLKTV